MSLVKRLEASEHAHSTKEIGRLCFYLVLVWAEHRKILPYAKSDRHQRSLWSRLAEAKVREDSPSMIELSACTVRAVRAYFHISFYVSHARALTTPGTLFCSAITSDPARFFTMFGTRPHRIPDSRTIYRTRTPEAAIKVGNARLVASSKVRY